jgi:hypothetical protein
MKIKFLVAGLFILANLSTGCNSKKENESTTASTKSSDTGASPGNTLPFLSSQDVNTLYSQAEQVDIIFYKLPMSVSQTEPASAKNTVLYVTPAAPIITGKCEPVGRLSWISGGKIIKEADFYIGDGCNHFVFFENGQPVYKNAMGLEGVQFFQTIMSQAGPQNIK